VFKDKRPGIAFTEKLSADALKICLDDALSHTRLTDPVAFSIAENFPAVSTNFDRVSPDFDKVTFADLTRLAIELEQKARGLDKRIENVPYTGAGRSASTGYFLNSCGVRYEQRDQDFSAYSAAVATLGEQKKMGFYSNSRLNFTDLKNLNIAEEVVRRTTEQLGAKPVSSGHYTILFSNRVSGQVISMYSSPFFAEMAIRGQSRLKGRLGETIASPALHIASAAHDVTLKGSRARDSEGMPTQHVEVVQGGKFVNFLYNLEAAALDKAKPTGNAVRSVGSKASTGFKNLVVARGKSTAQELIAAGKILVIDKLEGSAGCSAISGEMSIGAQGFLYENGQRVQPVDRITLSSNYFDMIKNIEAISSEYNEQWSSVRVPDLLISGISVAG
jgi:PmbA protein